MKRTPNFVSLCLNPLSFPLVASLRPISTLPLSLSPVTGLLSLPFSLIIPSESLAKRKPSTRILHPSRSARPLVLITAPQSTPLSSQYRSEKVSQERRSQLYARSSEIEREREGGRKKRGGRKIRLGNRLLAHCRGCICFLAAPLIGPDQT